MLLIAAILAVLLIAKLFGELANRFGFPSVIGELSAGVFIGPVLLWLYGITGIEQLAAIPNFVIGNPIFQVFSDLGIFFLMILAGMEMSLDELLKVKYRAFVVTSGGVILSFILGYAVGAYYKLPFLENFFLASFFTVTAVAVCVKLLLDLNLLRSRIGYTIVTAATVDDVIGMFLLTVLIAMSKGTVTALNFAILLGKVVLFFFVFLGVGRYLMFNFIHISRKMKSSEAVFTMALVGGLLIGIAAEAVGLSMIIGAFIAGLLIREATLYTRDGSMIAHRFSGIALGFLAPIFFVWVGLFVNLHALATNLGFTLLVIIAALAGKIIGCGGGAWLTGFKKKEALTIGIGMSARGVVGLVILEMGRAAGVIGPTVFSIAVAMAFVTTLITPVLFGRLIKDAKI
ncbi:MAG: cation:proton antiporter [archaeon]